MRRVRLLGWTLAMSVTLVTACEPTESTANLTRVAIHGVREGEPIALEDDGTVSLDDDTRVYAALVRIGRVTLRSDSDVIETDFPVNVDLFERTIVVEEQLAGEQLDTVELTFPEPAGDGVTHNESLSVFVAGLIRDVPFEYRDRSMDPVEVVVATSSSRVVEVHFDLDEWFAGIEERELVTSGEVILIDEDHNASVAGAIEAAMRSSVGVDLVGLSHDDHDDS